MNRLAQVVVMLTLALWGLAAMHCKLEVLPALDFLKSCCSAEAAPPSSEGCETDGCVDVEEGSYRAEEQRAAAPPPLLVPAPVSPVVDALLPEFRAQADPASESPPELPRVWQFAHRAALPPRAPSIAS